ncbi:hypothetical protein PN462_12230 [Spirulina sp. CS-785/01]|uniref:hypothetical protein n=1 Tax=Spirulina sp. CS-785/01 TaxID=3021716 RepID=UPI00233119F8|nr:hypothetical protein [Spirulina sp. CS-785/01]MDB9313871.1 hypothetical protein [Spirulina sp. CS-785/01]
MVMYSQSELPNYVNDFFAFYGYPKQGVTLDIGTFYEKVEPGADLEQVALRHYRYLIGKSWSPSWMHAWQLAYQRPPENQGDIVKELYITVADLYDEPGAEVLVELGLRLDPREPDEYEIAHSILAAVFDAPEVSDFRIYACGDGEVIEGYLAIGYRANGETTTLSGFND